MGSDEPRPVGRPTVANVARMRDYLLGGGRNFAADRFSARAVLDAYPQTRAALQADRAFRHHAVEYALDHGVTQFLDLGTGIPGHGDVHEIARARRPRARVAYVDDDPASVAESASALAGIDGVTITVADIADPGVVLASSGVRAVIDLAEPIAVLMIASLHFVRGDVGPIVAGYRRAMAPGSVLALSHVSADYPDDPAVAAALVEAAARYGATETPMVLRDRAEILALFDGLTLAPPGLADVGYWWPGHRGGPLGLYGVVSEPVRGPEAVGGLP